MPRWLLFVGPLSLCSSACGGSPFVEIYQDPPVTWQATTARVEVLSTEPASTEEATSSAAPVASAQPTAAPSDAAPSAPVDSEATAPAPAADPAAAPVDPTPAPPLMLDGKRCDELTELRRAELDDLFDNPEVHLSDVRIEPVRPGEPDGGLLFVMLREGSLLWRWGLRQGDELLRLNDSPLSEPEDVLEAVFGLRQATSIRAELRRGGKPRVLCFKVP